jgi:hypothetical protein
VTREVVGGGRLIATEDGRSEILFAGFSPFDHAEAGGIVNDAASADSHTSGDVGVSIHARPTAIDETKFAMIYLQDSDIGILANGKCTKFGVMNFIGRIDGSTFDEFVERHAHRGEFRKNIVKADDGEIIDVQIGGNGIREKTLFDSRNGVAEPEASSTVANVENYSALAGFEKNGIELAIGKNDGKLLSENVGVNVSRPSLFEDEIGISAIRTRPEIVHNGAIRGLGTGDGAIHSGPGRVFSIPGLVRPVMSGFHADDEVGIFVDGLGAALDVHLVDALLQTAAHAVGHNIKKSEHADLGVIHDAFLFRKKRFSAGGAGINDGGYAGSEGEISGDGVGLDVRTSGRIKPIERRASCGDVNVNVDEAGSDVETGGIDDFFGGGRGNVFFDSGDFTGSDSDIHDAINLIGGINDVAALEEEFVAWSLGLGTRKKRESRGEDEKRSCEKFHTGSFAVFQAAEMAQGKQAD